MAWRLLLLLGVSQDGDTCDQGGSVSIRVFDQTFEALAKTLDLRAQKQVLISANIANADTPGYQAKTLDFEGALAKALTEDSRGGRNPIAEVEGELYNQINDVVREDGNTVTVMAR